MTNMFHNLYFSDKNVVYCLFHEEKEVEVHRQSKYFKDNTVFISSLYQGLFNPNNFIY